MLYQRGDVVYVPFQYSELCQCLFPSPVAYSLDVASSPADRINTLPAHLPKLNSDRLVGRLPPHL